MVHGIDVVGVHIKSVARPFVVGFTQFEPGFANADKRVHYTAAGFVDLLHFRAESTLREIDDGPRLRGMHPRSYASPASGALAPPETRRHAPTLPEPILH